MEKKGLILLQMRWGIRLGVLLLAGFFFFFLCRGINLSYVGFNAWNFNTYALIAHNYLQFGFLQTKFAPVISVSSSLPTHPTYYLHHPSLLYITMSVSFSLFGETFWSGRLPVILTSLASFFLTFLIGRQLQNSLFGFFSALAFVLMPATVVFGRMIGHEAFVLLFALLFVFSVLRYQEGGRFRYLLGAFFSVILGVLSDWPMVYFILASVPYFFYKRRLRLWLGFLVTALTTALIFLSFIYSVLGSFQDLLQAFFNRSTGQLLSQTAWPFRWISVLGLRIFLYFSPLFVLFSLLYSGITLKKKLYNDRSILIFIFFVFGLLHVLLYPEGSFGHPYWIYYLAPFFAFSSGYVLYALWRRRFYFLLGVFLLLSLLFFLKIENWKYKEVRANLWRYDLMNTANRFIPAYEPVIINENGVVDPDLIAYTFKHPFLVSAPSTNLHSLAEKADYFLYSCITRCEKRTGKLKSLLDAFKYQDVQSPQAEMFVVNLTQPSRKVISENGKETVAPSKTLPYRQTRLKALYIFLQRLFSAPQL